MYLGQIFSDGDADKSHVFDITEQSQKLIDFNEDMTQQFEISQIQCKYTVKLLSCDKLIEVLSTMRAD